MNAPQIINSVADSLLVAIIAEEVGGHGEESHILHLELKDGCIKYGR